MTRHRDRDLFDRFELPGAPVGLRRRVLSAVEATSEGSGGWLESTIDKRWFRLAVPIAATILVLLHTIPGRSAPPAVDEELSIDGVNLSRSIFEAETTGSGRALPLRSLDDDELWTEI